MSGVSFAVGVVAIDPVPAGGTTGQALVKKSDSDYDTQWSSVVDPATLGTMSTQNANSVAITGGAIDGTTIGSTTPAAATFTTLTATGQTSLGGAAGSESFRALNLASSANWIEAKGSVAGTGASGIPTLFVNGSDTSTQLGIGVKGASGYIKFFTSGAVGTEQFRVAATTSAVNYVQVTGGATLNMPMISAQGSDSDVALGITSKASNPINFYSKSGGNRQVRIDGNAVAVNYIDLYGSVSGNALQIKASGADANISYAFVSKGTGAIDLAAGSSGVNISNGGTVTAITRTNAGANYTSQPTVTISAPTTAGGVQATASVDIVIAAVSSIANGGTGYTAGDVLTFSGGTSTQTGQVTVSTVSGGVITAVTVTRGGDYTVAPSNPVSVTGGTGSGATFNLSFGILAPTITNAGSGYVEQPTVSFSGGGGSGAAAYATVGGTTTVKSVGNTLNFYTANSGIGLQVYDSGGGSGTAGGYWKFGQNFGSNQALMLASGFGLISSGGATNLQFYTNSVSQEQLRVAHTASAVNYVQVTGAATGGQPVISAQGSDTDINLNVSSKNAGAIIFFVNGKEQFRVANGGASAVNNIQAVGQPAGNAPYFQARGTDTNIDLALTPKGTGLVRFGTLTATADTAISGYITIKDSGGTTRKLAVIT